MIPIVILRAVGIMTTWTWTSWNIHESILNTKLATMPPRANPEPDLDIAPQKDSARPASSPTNLFRTAGTTAVNAYSHVITLSERGGLRSAKKSKKPE